MKENIAYSMAKPRLIVILGATAVGKTGTAIDLAKIFDTEIISGDSMLVFKGFDIGAAKPALTERQGIIHHLIDILDGRETYNVFDFCTAAGEKIREINDRGKIPILCGGTGLYIKALIEGYQFNVTGGNEDFRRSVEISANATANPRQYLLSRLEKNDAISAKSLAQRDFRRIIRAIEVAECGGETISRTKKADTLQWENEKTDITAENLVYDAFIIGLRRERAALYQRINDRVETMLKEGLIAETEKLLADGISRNSQPMRSIGYRETAAYLAGELTAAALAEEIKKNTRHFAKRQFTWFRKMPYIYWYDLVDGENEKIKEKISRDVKEFFRK